MLNVKFSDIIIGMYKNWPTCPRPNFRLHGSRVPDKKRRRKLTISNTLEDFQRLASSLSSYELPVRVGFEATGNYHRPLAHYLGQAGFELKLTSSVGLAVTASLIPRIMLLDCQRLRRAASNSTATTLQAG
jgi:hypothetical protein